VRDFLKGLFKLLGAIAVLALIAGGILHAFFVRVVEVGHDAMAPTIVAGDQVLVWRTSNFELGDMVLCPHPREAGRFVMGRIVGRPGQTVEIGRGAQLAINGDRPDRDLRGTVDFYDARRRRNESMTWGIEDILDHDHKFMFRERRPPEMRPHRVQGGYFLLSDNRSFHGEDSRSFDEVPGASCIGVVFARLQAAEAPAAFGNASFQLLE
jgi:signal peptidase I